MAAGTAVKGGSTTTTTTSSGVTTVSSQLGNGLNLGWVPKINGIYTLAALAHFLETNAGGNVLSTPNLIAMDNEEAKIVVGQNIPLVTGSFTNTGGSSSSVNPFQTVERQDVGITLRIKSQVGENGTVRMTIYEENSSVSSSSDQTTNKTSVETYQPKAAKQFDRILDIDQLMANAVALKYLDAPLTKEQLVEFIQIPPR